VPIFQLQIGLVSAQSPRSPIAPAYPRGSDAESETRYSPAESIGTRIIPVIGQPNPKHISTSEVERVPRVLLSQVIADPELKKRDIVVIGRYTADEVVFAVLARRGEGFSPS
jgi:hypothetical protein